ncbi:ABC transporter substrate-binding protein [Mesorhizobium sp. B263B2A]|uniref:ABC transporter substrate-binding protein n=1 Tax=Mesorhizobium sp. B263B2A TaxID=2876669 RepID=UPI001CD0F122|nr:ABC transporter substrate-binding protein [Mesorhizobium sp. B263B2A]MCA0029274.1 ABC transporter substrate-binding protein [Mesorhizobium sp. B263B2A]
MTSKRSVLLLATLSLFALPVHDSMAKTLVYCTEASPDTFDPALASGTRDASATALYNRIVEFEPGTTKVRPGLAEKWEISDDSLTYTFHLRHGVKFHTVDGFTPSRDFNADDVLFTFERQADAQNPFHNYASRPYGYFDGMGMPRLVASWRKLDNYTVVMTLKAPHAPMLANLAMDFASVVSREYADRLLAEKRPLDLATKPVGTGPFQLVDYQQDAVIRYKANPDYWRGRPRIDDLIFAITTDASVRLEKLRAGECDVMPYPNPADLAAIKTAPGIKVMQQEGLNTGYLAFNTLQKPFNDPRVRKAIDMAIDRKALVDVIFRGTGEIARNPLPPTSWAYDKTTPDPVFDPDAARQALTDAGIKDLHMKVWAMPVQRPYNPNAQRMAEMIQSDLARIGVTVDIVTYEWAEYLARSKPVDRDGAMLFGFTGDNGDPDNFLSVPLGCAGVGATNRANWCFPAFDDLLRQAAGIVDLDARMKLYAQAQGIFREQTPWVVIAHSVVSIPMRERVQGYVMDPFDHHDFSNVDISE